MANNHAEGKAISLRSLLDAKAWVEAKRGDSGSTPLMMAAATGNSEGVDVILEFGADVQAVSTRGTTCLDMCWHSRGLAEVLQRAGAVRGTGVTGEGRRPPQRSVGGKCGVQPGVRGEVRGEVQRSG